MKRIIAIIKPNMLEEGIMKVKISGLSVVLTAVTIGIIIGGCASNRSNLAGSGTITIEHVPSKGHLFSGTSVHQEGHGFIIRGQILRRNATYMGSGHVDIAIVNPENEILAQISACYTPRIIPRERRRGGSTFKVRLASMPPAKSRVRIAYHRLLKSDHQTFHCEQNAAAPNGRRKKG